MAKPKVTRYEVRKTRDGWGGFQGREGVATGTTKATVVAQTIAVAKRQPAASVRIKKANGQYQEERTYPRGADPRTSKG